MVDTHFREPGVNELYIRLPRRLKHKSDIEELFPKLGDISGYKKIFIDFRLCEYGEPFAMLYVATMVRLLRRKYSNIEFDLLYDHDALLRPGLMSYGAHIGYFRVMGFDIGNEVGRARLTRRCFPIEVWDIAALKAESEGRAVGELVREKSAKLASILAQSDSSDAFDILQFSIQEIARNAIEHSDGRTLLILGQYWPISQDAEIVIFDDGVGLFETLMDIEVMDIKDNRAALRVALLPGISGVPRSVRIQQEGPFRNSGFGLYMISRYCGFLGKFEIMSNGDYLRLQTNRQIEGRIPYSGTAVSIHLNLKKLDNLRELHDKIVSSGERMNSHILNTLNIDASTASKFLYSDFNIKIR